MSEIESFMQTATEIGALVRNTHVVLNAKTHTGDYFCSREFLYRPEYCTRVARELVRQLRNFETTQKIEIDAAVGPLQEGGPWLAHLASEWMLTGSNQPRLPYYFTKQVAGHQRLRREYDLGIDDRQSLRGKNIVIFNDVLSLGETVGQIFKEVKAAGGKPIALVVICDRRPPTVKLPRVKIIRLVRVDWPAWDSNDCPLCPQTPINPDLGIGKKYLEIVQIRGKIAYLGMGER